MARRRACGSAWCGVSMAQPIALRVPPPDRDVHGQWRAVFACACVERPGVIPPDGANYQHPIGAGSWDFGISRRKSLSARGLSSRMRLAREIPTGHPWSFGLLSLIRGDTWFSPGVYSEERGPAGRPIYQVTPEGAVRPMGAVGGMAAGLLQLAAQQSRSFHRCPEQRRV